MVFEQEAYIGDSELSPVGAPTSTPEVLVSKQGGVGVSFEGSLCRKNSVGGTDAGENGGGACPIRGGRCQCVTACQW
jgi:hypothetical protein